jgi:hypothetical protein
VLELVETRASVVGAFASARALDALRPAGATRCRVAPDEAMFVAPPSAAAALVRDASAVTAGDVDAIVLDTTDGWAVWTLAGEAVRDAFARLSSVEPSHGYAQGEVAGVAVRVIAQEDRIHLLVPAMWGDHLRRRILARCPEVVARSDPQAWEPGPG